MHPKLISAAEAIQLLNVYKATDNNESLGARALGSVMQQYNLLGDGVAILSDLFEIIDENENNLSEDDLNYVAELRERYEKLKEDIG